MALFVDLGDDDAEPPQDFQGGKPVWRAPAESETSSAPKASPPGMDAIGKMEADQAAQIKDSEPDVSEVPNQNSTTEALGCYPIIVTIAAALDLNSLDNLSRTCRQIRAGLLQYRKILMLSTLRCINERLPVDPEAALRYRARVGNLYYMEETGRTAYSGKSARCARDLVSECRRCGTVVCRNCAIKPPANVVLRDRHRRLCKTCTKVPLGALAKPALLSDTPLASDVMQSTICRCVTDGVWLCQPCGRSIGGADREYKNIWKWRNQYGEVLGGLGTGIGEGDRGVPCGREEECLGAKDCEHETDCDAADAAAHDYLQQQQQQQQQQQRQQQQQQQSASPHAPLNPTNHHHGGGVGFHSSHHLSFQHHQHNHHSHHNHSHHHHHHHIQGHHHLHHLNPTITTLSPPPPPPTPLNNANNSSAGSSRRHTPSPGYARHEIEGIGGVVKTKLVSMVKVGACVPEWADEVARGQVLGREVSGSVRSWCGWCWRVVPGREDVERDAAVAAAAQKGSEGLASEVAVRSR